MCEGYVRWELKEGKDWEDREKIRVWNGQFLGMMVRVNTNDLEWSEKNVLFPHKSYQESLEVRQKLPKTDPIELEAAYARKRAAIEKRKREQEEQKHEL
jgi:hypothetical protein